MIVVYPMIVSNAVSENTLPALTKMMEQYVLVYMQDDILSSINGMYGGPRPQLRYKIKGNKIIGESIDLNEVNPPDEFHELPGTKKNPDEEIRKREKEIKKREKELKQQPKLSQDNKNNDFESKKLALDKEKLALQKSKEARDKEIYDKEKKDKGSKVRIDVSDKTISIEPTWMKIETDEFGTKFVGIKVVPYRVISDAKLSHLLMHDMQIKGITAKFVPLGRKIMGKMLRLTRKGPISGDPKKDIIYRTTGHKGETFVVLEKNNDVDEYFLDNTKKINRLFKLGWGNFIIADDVLQIAHFCLRAHKGMCQGMSYRMMYKTLGQSGVYEDLEDMRKQNSSLFKMKRARFSKLLGESKVQEKLINYQEIL